MHQCCCFTHELLILTVDSCYLDQDHLVSFLIKPYKGCRSFDKLGKNLALCVISPRKEFIRTCYLEQVLLGSILPFLYADMTTQVVY